MDIKNNSIESNEKSLELTRKVMTKVQIDKEEVMSLIRKYGLVKGINMIKLTAAKRNQNKS